MAVESMYDIQLTESETLPNNQKLSFHYFVREDDKEGFFSVFINSTMSSDLDFSQVKRVGWVEFRYEKKDSLPTISFSVEMSLPHPKTEQYIIKNGLTCVSRLHSKIEKMATLTFEETERFIKQINV